MERSTHYRLDGTVEVGSVIGYSNSFLISQIWDTAGQERFKVMEKKKFKNFVSIEIQLRDSLETTLTFVHQSRL